MIRDLDRALSVWLSHLLPTGVTVALNPPRQSRDAVLGLFLHTVRAHDDAAPADWRVVRGDDGRVTGRARVGPSFQFGYLVAAVADDAETEHELLGTVLVGAALAGAIPAEHVPAPLAGIAPPAVRCAPCDSVVDAAAMWASWQLEPRTALELAVTAAVPITAETVSAAPRELALRGELRDRLPDPVP